jgi:hypothetical protein
MIGAHSDFNHVVYIDVLDLFQKNDNAYFICLVQDRNA